MILLKLLQSCIRLYCFFSLYVLIRILDIRNMAESNLYRSEKTEKGRLIEIGNHIFCIHCFFGRKNEILVSVVQSFVLISKSPKLDPQISNVAHT